MSILDRLRSLVPVGGEVAKAERPPIREVFADPGTLPYSWQIAAKVVESNGRARNPVGDSDDLQRILRLPRRPQIDLDPNNVNVATLVKMITAKLAKSPLGSLIPCRCAEWGRPCITELKPAQAWALYEAEQTEGILGPIGVGHGKTGLDLLTPMVLRNCKLAVLLIPPGLKDQLLADYQAWGQHFKVPSLVIGDKGYIIPGRPVLHVVFYSKFSRASSTDLLEQLCPDTIIADEGHKLRNRETATTGRVLRYFAEHPGTRLFAWSGTLTAKSIKDYGHLAALALGEGSPLPCVPAKLDEWALAIDPNDWPAPIGALRGLCAEGEHIHAAFHRRLVETRGVIATKSGAIDAAINFYQRKAPPIPIKLLDMIRVLRDKDAPGGWTRPDGEELVDAMSVARCARELACGFFYRWKFPRGEPEELILRWFEARKAWHKELRAKLHNRREHLDSPLLCAKAAIRAEMVPAYEGDLPVWKSDTWGPWREIRDKVYHETEAVWVDTYLAEDAASWGLKNRGIVWYEHDAFGVKVAALGKLPLHAGGPDAGSRIAAEKGDRSLVCSIRAHGTGRDGLQRLFSQQLVASPPSSGGTWEQLLGRLHRIGQDADEVDTFVYRHTREMAEALDRAIKLARFIQGTEGTLQKLLSANLGFDIDDLSDCE